MTTLNTDSFSAILTLIGAILPADLNPVDFVDFGKMTSHIYRAKFYKVVQEMVDSGEIQYSSVSVVIYFATLIKNKKRIVDAMANLSPKYGTTTWFQDTLKFYQTACVQYVSEAERTGLFPVVNIPSCQPNLAAHFFKMHLMRDGKARSDVDLFKIFMENLWFCQLRVTEALKNKHQDWENKFWTQTVKKSKNPDSGRYEKGFNQTYYETKRADDYGFIVNGQESIEIYDEPAIISWLKAP